jgi:hypothetical protein
LEIVVGLIFLILAPGLAYIFTKGKTKKKKYIIWGITTMVAIAPCLAWTISIAYTMIEGNPWAGIALLAILFPLLFIIGLILLLVGIFKKAGRNSDGKII